MMIYRIKKILLKSVILSVIFCASVVSFSMPVAVGAGSDKSFDTYTLLEPLPCVDGAERYAECEGGLVKKVDLNQYIGYIFKLAIALSAFLAVVVIMWAGFRYMTLESVPDKVDARNRIQNAIFGLLAILGSYLILKTIDPRLVNISVSIPQLKYATEKTSLTEQLYQDQIEFARRTNKELQELYNQEKEINTQIDELEVKLTDDFISDEEASEIREKILELKASREKIIIESSQKYPKGVADLNTNNIKSQITSPTSVDKYSGKGGNYIKTDLATNNYINTSIRNTETAYNSTIEKIKNSNPDLAKTLENEKQYTILTQRYIANNTIINSFLNTPEYQKNKQENNTYVSQDIKIIRETAEREASKIQSEELRKKYLSEMNTELNQTKAKAGITW